MKQREHKYRAFLGGQMMPVGAIEFFTDGTCNVQCGEDWSPIGEKWGNFLLEWTGLRDVRGREIFEGDILKCPVTVNREYHGDFCYNEVIKRHGQWLASHLWSEKGKLPRGYTCGFLLDSWFEFSMKLFVFTDDYEPHTKVEIIGNIHEHPHLLSPTPTAP